MTDIPAENGWRLSGTVIKFGLICSALFSFCIFLPDHFFSPLNLLTASLVGSLLGLFNAAAVVQGDRVTLSGFQVVIITECTGVYLALLFASFVAAYPAALRHKVIGMIAGVGFLNAANFVRIAGVIALGAWQPWLFEYAHVYLAQVLMVLLACATCLVWLHWSTASGSAEGLPGFLVRFIACGSTFFLLWLPVHRSYVQAIDRAVVYLFSLGGYVLRIPPRQEIYHHTLSIIIFVSLALASRTPTLAGKIGGALAGVALLALTHLLFRVTYVWSALGVAWVPPLHAALYLLNQYLLPVLLWQMLVRTRSPGPLPA